MKVLLSLASAFREEERNGFGLCLHSEQGHICVNVGGQYSPCKHSVTEFIVDEKVRGQGHGNTLVQEVIRRYHSDIGAQVSSVASLVVFYKNGFRYAMDQKMSQADCLKEFKDSGGSLYMVFKPAKSFED